MAEKAFDRHHIVPRSRDGTNIRDNIVRLDIRVHRALHLIFSNQTPTEQIQRIMGINSTALSEEFKTDVARVLAETDPEYVYSNGILKPSRHV